MSRNMMARNDNATASPCSAPKQEESRLPGMKGSENSDRSDLMPWVFHFVQLGNYKLHGI